MKRNFDTFSDKNDTIFNWDKQFNNPFSYHMKSSNKTDFILKKRKTLSSKKRDNIWKYWYGDVDTHLCHCCKERRLYRYQLSGWSLGHDIPFSKGGSYHIDNLIPICAQCNTEMGNDYTISGYHLAYHEDKYKDIYRFKNGIEWFVKAFDFTKIKTITDLREAYRLCGAFDKIDNDILIKNYYKNFKVIYKGRVLKDHEFLPEDILSEDFLADIYP